MRTPAVAAIAGLVLVSTVTACGNAPAEPLGAGQEPADRVPAARVMSTSGSAARGDAALRRGEGLVLETPRHGVQLCLGGVNYSYPPSCDGIELVGWDWSAVTGVETADGSTWGSSTVTGTWDGTRLTVTEAGPPVERPDDGDIDDLLGTPCEPPPGGWAVVDEATATDEAFLDVQAYIADQADYAGLWFDHSINPAYDDPGAGSTEALNDMTKVVLNVSFTGETTRHEAELRAVWGGALCVSTAPRSEAELMAIMDEVMHLPGLLGADPEPSTGTVNLQAVVDDRLQRQMDETYGPGVVVVTEMLQPLD